MTEERKLLIAKLKEASDWCADEEQDMEMLAELLDEAADLLSAPAPEPVEELKRQLAEAQRALDWYADEAAALAKNVPAKNDQAILASVTVLSLDGGKRAVAIQEQKK